MDKKMRKSVSTHGLLLILALLPVLVLASQDSKKYCKKSECGKLSFNFGDTNYYPIKKIEIKSKAIFDLANFSYDSEKYLILKIKKNDEKVKECKIRIETLLNKTSYDLNLLVEEYLPHPKSKVRCFLPGPYLKQSFFTGITYDLAIDLRVHNRELGLFSW